MKTELFYLLLTAILTGLLWIPVVIGYVTTRGVLTPRGYKDAPDLAAARRGSTVPTAPTSTRSRTSRRSRRSC